jgi:hypothetical protein
MSLVAHRGGLGRSGICPVTGLNRITPVEAQSGAHDPERTSPRPKYISFGQRDIFQLLSLDSYNDLILGGEYAAAFIGLIGTAALSYP